MVSQSVYVAPSSTWTSGDSLTASTTTYRYVPGYSCSTKEKPGPPGEGGPGGLEGDYDGEIRAAIRLAGSARSSIRLTRTYNGPDWTSAERVADQTEADRRFECGEQAIGQGRIDRDDRLTRADDGAKWGWLTLTHGRDQLQEVVEVGRLPFQHALDQPDDTECDLGCRPPIQTPLARSPMAHRGCRSLNFHSSGDTASVTQESEQRRGPSATNGAPPVGVAGRRRFLSKLATRHAQPPFGFHGPNRGPRPLGPPVLALFHGAPPDRLLGHRDGADHQRVDGAVVGNLARLVEGDDKLVALVLQAGIKGGAVIGRDRMRHVRVLPIPLDSLAHLDRHVVRSEPANRVGV